jgi:hypothetical protein
MTERLPQRPLHNAIVALAGTPDDASGIDELLTLIAQLTATLAGEVCYASVTVPDNGTFTTVAMSNDLALAVDEAQYADGKGPCLDALAGAPVSVNNIATTISWPHFRDKALSLGLKASLSIPLAAATGKPIAALNLYAYDPAKLAGLSAAVLAVFHGQPHDPAPEQWLGPGASQLISGLSATLDIHEQIHVALGIIMAREHVSSSIAYAILRNAAANSEISIFDAATKLAMDPDSV